MKSCKLLASLLVVAFILINSSFAFSYGYGTAGEDPLITMFKKIVTEAKKPEKSWTKISEVIEEYKEPISNMDAFFKVSLYPKFEKSISDKDVKSLIGTTAQVRVPAYEGAYLKLSSGGESKMVPWRPNEARLTLGKTLAVEVCITRKNTFGPLHLKDPLPASTGPHSFVPGKQQFSLEPVFIASALLAPVELHRP